MKTIAEVKKEYVLHHTSAKRGYISRKCEGVVSEYNGRYGKGYVIDRPRWDTTQYCYRDYYICK